MTGLRIDLSLGNGHPPVALPAHVRPAIIRKGAMPKLPQPHAAVAEALATPTGSAPLATLARGKSSACILICGITRPVPNRLFLRPTIEIMVAEGIPLEAITVLVATDLHRPNEGEELARLVGDPWVMATVRVENHFVRDEAMHIDLGRKVIAPCIAGHETIRTFRSARCAAGVMAVNVDNASVPPRLQSKSRRPHAGRKASDRKYAGSTVIARSRCNARAGAATPGSPLAREDGRYDRMNHKRWKLQVRTTLSRDRYGDSPSTSRRR